MKPPTSPISSSTTSKSKNSQNLPSALVRSYQGMLSNLRFFCVSQHEGNPISYISIDSQDLDVKSIAPGKESVDMVKRTFPKSASVSLFYMFFFFKKKKKF